jgi:ribonuclease HI
MFNRTKEEPWCKPPLKQYKVNTDACFIPNGQGAIAGVVRNARGKAIAGSAKPRINLLDAATAEAEAIRLGLQVADSIGIPSVIVESDCAHVINACNSISDVWGPYTAILMDCFELSQRIGAASFQLCSRDSNKVAHNLARLSYDSDSIFSWDGDPPPIILRHVMNDIWLFEA